MTGALCRAAGTQKEAEAEKGVSYSGDDVKIAVNKQPDTLGESDKKHDLDQTQYFKHNQTRCGFATGTEE